MISSKRAGRRIRSGRSILFRRQLARTFGFYNRKDIEIRVYPSHDVAMAAGRESAEMAIETEKLVR